MRHWDWEHWGTWVAAHITAVVLIVLGAEPLLVIVAGAIGGLFGAWMKRKEVQRGVSHSR